MVGAGSDLGSDVKRWRGKGEAGEGLPLSQSYTSIIYDAVCQRRPNIRLVVSSGTLTREGNGQTALSGPWTRKIIF